jgi:transcription antitermination factor NusG
MIDNLALNETLEYQKWYVIKTNSRAEKKVEERLQKLGFEVFLPLQTSIKQWSDRKKKVSTPLISSTLFLHSFEYDLKFIYNTPGFHSVLHYQGKPAEVRDFEINNLRIILQADGECKLDETNSLETGDLVEVIKGPFQGLIATSIEVNRNHKLIVEIESLGQKFVVHVSKSFVRKLLY